MDTQNSNLPEIIELIKKEYQPLRLFLFGSRSSDQYRSNSDYDFVVVVKATDKTRVENAIKANQIFRHLSVTVDLFVYSENEFNEWKSEFNSIPEVALNQGKEIDLGSL